MTFSFRPARRENAHLLIGLAGPTGAGKTYTALLLASGIVAETGGRIAFIDTESGRALQYAPPGEPGFQFDYAELREPFSPSCYLEAFLAAEEHAGRGGVVIIDSVSHEHEGPGGVLEMHDATLEAMYQRALRSAQGKYEPDREKYNFPAWAEPKAERRKLINRVIQSRCHIIFCFRAKEKNAFGKDKNGRQTIVPIGWQPITGDEWPYEMTVFALLNPERKGVPIIDAFQFGKLPLPLRSLVSTEVAINQEMGRKLAKWCGNGTETEVVPDARSAHDKTEAAATGKMTKERAQQIAQAMKDSPSVKAIDDLWACRLEEIMNSPQSYQKRFHEVYNDTRAGLVQVQGGAEPNHFDDDVAHLEPEEWRQDEGRVEDERQGEML